MITDSEKYILIIGNYSSANRGDAAIMDGLIKLLGKEFPEHNLKISSYFPEVAEHFHNLPAIGSIIRTKWRPLSTRMAELVKIAILLLFPLSVFHFITRDKSIINAYKNASLIVMVGGGNLHAPYFNELWGRMSELVYCAHLGKKLYIAGQSLGPFGKGPLKQYCKYALNKCTRIFPREEISRQRLIDIGVTTPLTVIPDTAFAIEANDFSNEGSVYLENEGVDIGNTRGIITVSVRKWLGDKRKNEQFQTNLALALDQLVEQGFYVLFLATCTSFGNYHNDDRETAFSVWRRMNGRRQAHILVNEYSPYEIGAILKTALFHIGMRLHSCILAFDVGIPCIAIEYESKTSGVMKQMGLSDYVLHFSSFEPEQLLSLSDKLQSDFEYISNTVLSSTKIQRDLLVKTVSESLDNNFNK